MAALTFASAPWPSRSATQLLLRPAAEVERVGVTAIHISGVISRNGLEPVDLHRFENEGRNLAILHAADADTRLVGRIGLVGRIVGHVKDIVLVDMQAARPTELLPFEQKFSVLVESLNAVVRAVGDEQPASRIHGKAMRHVELARSLALLAPLLDVLAILVELDDAVVGIPAVAISDEDIAVGRYQDVGWRVKRVLCGAGDA